MSLLLRLPRSTPLLLALASALPGCGSRSHLLDASSDGAGGTGGAGATSTSSDSTTSSTGDSTTSTTLTTTSSACAALLVQPPSNLTVVDGSASRPRLSPDPLGDQALLSLLSTLPGQASKSLFSARVDAFTEWPPSANAVFGIAADVVDYEVGPGASGTVGLVQRDGMQAELYGSWITNLSPFDVPITTSSRIQFVTGLADRFFFAGANETPEYEVLGIGSYQPNSLPQTEGPLVCTPNPIHAAAVALPGRFLLAITQPGPNQKACPPGAKNPGTTAWIHRYDSPSEPGSMLEYKGGSPVGVLFDEPIVHLGMAPAKEGAWLVFQTDGSTAESPPPVFAAKIDVSGAWSEPNELYAVTPGGYLPPDVAVAAFGDRLAVAWIDAIDPSAPLILVQLVEPDGSLGPGVSIPTNEAWYSSDLRLLTSPDGQKLLLSWSVSPEEGSLGVARVDCADGS